MSHPFFTIGHSTRTTAEFAELLQGGGVRLIADIRKVPRSRTNPQFNTEVLGAALAPYQISYLAIPELGGLRGRSTAVPAEANGWWTNKSFHNYADYALSEDYRRGFQRLLELGGERPTAIMCSEAVWWRCHRRLVADWLIAAGHPVFHLMDGGRIEPATLNAGAHPARGAVTYPAS